MLRVRPRSTWRRATSQVVVAELIMGSSLIFRTVHPQTRISCRETAVHTLDTPVEAGRGSEAVPQAVAMTDATTPGSAISGVAGDPGALAKTASSAYDAALEVIASV